MEAVGGVYKAERAVSASGELVSSLQRPPLAQDGPSRLKVS